MRSFTSGPTIVGRCALESAMALSIRLASTLLGFYFFVRNGAARDHGFADFVDSCGRESCVSAPPLLTLTPHLPLQVSFTNGICTSKGGTHVAHATEAVVECILKQVDFTTFHFRISIFLFVCVYSEIALRRSTSKTRPHR